MYNQRFSIHPPTHASIHPSNPHLQPSTVAYSSCKRGKFNLTRKRKMGNGCREEGCKQRRSTSCFHVSWRQSVSRHLPSHFFFHIKKSRNVADFSPIWCLRKYFCPHIKIQNKLEFSCITISYNKSMLVRQTEFYFMIAVMFFPSSELFH